MILVTGATGLVGSHLLKELVGRGHTVRALYRSAPPSSDFSGKVQWVRSDILDVVSLEEAMKGVTQVYHCAAVVSFQPKRKQQLLQTNIEGTANVVNACLDAGVQKLLFVSSVSALGRIREGEAINETMNWTAETNNSEYGKSKYLAEMEVWRGIGEGLNAVIVNPVIILGSGDWESSSSRIFKSAYEEFPWYTDGVSGFVDVLDVVRAMILLMEKNINGQRFILSAYNVPYRTIFNEAAQQFGKRRPHRKVTPLLAEIVWRLEAIKEKMTGKEPLLTRETAQAAQAKAYFNNEKLFQYLPDFQYTPLSDTIQRVCSELKQQYKL